MRYGIVLPTGRADQQVDLARRAESAGWDGVFVWEGAYGVDAWTLLGAMAAVTSKVRLGTMLTPLPWRRPWKLASQAATVAALSGGRAILAVGLGAVDDALGSTGEVTDRRERADLLDDGLSVIRSLWGGSYVHEGPKFSVDLDARAGDLAEVMPVDVATTTPIWCVGAWNRPKSMRRVLRCDGLLPNVMAPEGSMREMTPADVVDMRAWLDAAWAEAGGQEAVRGPAAAALPFDIVTEGETSGPDAASVVAPWVEAGCTWWLETRWMLEGDLDARCAALAARIEEGPPAPS
jgi:alkanesulfonate monooxygenase SsuD/methylene tetrahydromethanopterin reductase-like flavin-dependent oxidoreductase (luciferase family)